MTTLRLKHIYGRSHFGSGGAFGRLTGSNVTTTNGDNGFVA